MGVDFHGPGAFRLPGARLDARARESSGWREPRKPAIIREMAAHRKLR
jgi:hypothetical protein